MCFRLQINEKAENNRRGRLSINTSSAAEGEAVSNIRSRHRAQLSRDGVKFSLDEFKSNINSNFAPLL